MREVLVGYRRLCLGDLLQAVRSAGERTYLAIEIIRGYADTMTRQHRSLHVLHVVPPEHLHRHIALIRIVRDTLDILTCAFGYMTQVLVALEIDERTDGLDAIDELTEGLHVLREGREYIDMVPCDTGEDSYMRVVPEEFRSQIEWGGQVLITLKDGVFGRVAEAYHALKALNLRTHHIIGFDTEAVEHIEDHRSGGGLSVTAAYHDADLVLRLLVEVLGEGVDLEPQLAGPHQLRIILASVHTENDGIDILRDAFGMPTYLIGQQTRFAKVRQGGVEDLIIRSRHLISLFRSDRQCQVMHCRAADSYKMDFCHLNSLSNSSWLTFLASIFTIPLMASKILSSTTRSTIPRN